MNGLEKAEKISLSLQTHQEVITMFNQIAFRYDLLNQLFSFGIHRRWRRKAISLLADSDPDTILDVATGTGDFAIAAAGIVNGKVIGIDLSERMLSIAEQKIRSGKLTGRIELQIADVANLPFSSGQFDAITVGFGVRNFDDLSRSLLEMYRVLRPGGLLAVLEFSPPGIFLVRQVYHFYLRFFCPAIGKLVSGNGKAYNYLYKSIVNFPHGERFKRLLMDAGFDEVKLYPQTLGVTTIYIACKGG